MSHSPTSEDDFGALLEMYICKQRSIDDLQRHTRFCQLLRETCYWFQFKSFGVVYGPEDLYQDSFMKVRKSGHKLQIAEDILSEEEFSGWLFVLVRNVLRSKDKQFNRARRAGCVRCDEPSEVRDRPAPEVDYDGQYLFSLFRDFIKRYPEEYQRAVLLCLTGFSLRQIKDILDKERPNSNGTNVCYGTIRKWEITIFDEFKESLGLKMPKQKKKRSRRKSGT